MGFWVFMLMVDMLVPVSMIGFGKAWSKAAPKAVSYTHLYFIKNQLGNRSGNLDRSPAEKGGQHSMSHPIEGLMNTAMQKIKEMVDVNTIIGDPIHVSDTITIIPVSKVSFGLSLIHI